MEIYIMDVRALADEALFEKGFRVSFAGAEGTA